MTTAKKSNGFEYRNKQNESPFETFLRYTNQKEASSKELSKILQNLDDNSHILDIGAGNGEYLELTLSQLKNKNTHLTLVEPSADLVRQLESRFATIPTRENTAIINSDLDNFLTSEKFDAILAAHLFYHIPRSEWPRQLDKLLSFLKPTGKLIIVLRDKDDAYAFKMELKPLLSDKPFSAMTIDDVISSLPNINKLKITRYSSESELKIPIGNTEDTESIIEFYLNEQWQNIPVGIQEKALNFISNKRGIFKQLDCLAVVERL